MDRGRINFSAACRRFESHEPMPSASGLRCIPCRIRSASRWGPSRSADKGERPRGERTDAHCLIASACTHVVACRSAVLPSSAYTGPGT
eukprot:3309458-Pleurochrysis_carterae.AAC.4